MLFTTLAQLTARMDPAFMAELGDDSVGISDITDPATIAVINQAISDASMEIESRLLGYVDIDDANNQRLLEPKCADLALYRLYARRYMGHDANPKRQEQEDVITWLRDVAKGLVHLQSTVRAGRVDYSPKGQDKVFSEDALADF